MANETNTLRLTQLQVAGAALKALNAEDAVAFQQAVSLARDVLELSDVALSKLLGVSRPSLQRWRSGTHAPHLFVRQKLIELLRAEVQRKVRIVESGKTSRRSPARAAQGELVDAE